MTSPVRADTHLALRATTIVLLLVVVALGGCIGAVRDYYEFEPDAQYVNPGVFPGNYKPAQDGSSVLVPRRFTLGDPEIFRVPSAIPHSAASGSAEMPAESTVYITIAAWLPSNGTFATYPTLVVAGPFFEQGNGTMLTVADTHPTIGFLLRNYLPLGYAVAAVASRGSGSSGGCMEFLGPREAADLDQAIRFLATQEWSNGNVGVIGSGYEGASAWMAAAQGNEYVRTIVPSSAFPDAFDLFYHNGTAETAASTTPFGFWAGSGVGKGNNPPPRPSEVPEPGPPVPTGVWVPRPFSANGREAYQDRQNLLCDEAYEGIAMGPYAERSGERGDAASDFWSARDYRARVLSGYDGSVFLLHGLQDWGVDPHSSVPFNVELKAAGIEVKEWYGQWGMVSSWPDRECMASTPVWRTLSCRWDFAETLLHWFDYYLKGNATADRGPWLQVEDNRGHWRNADAFPPTDANWTTLSLRSDLTLGEADGQETLVRLAPALDTSGAPRNIIELRSDVFSEDVHVSGLPTLEVGFESLGSGGSLSAWLFDEDADGKVFDLWFNPFGSNWMPVSSFGVPPVIGHTQMDLRFYDGDATGEPLVAGQRYTAQMQFEPLDVLIPKGHRLTLWIQQYPYPDHMVSAVPSTVDVVVGGDSALHLPTVQVEADDMFPVPGSKFPDPDYYDWSHVRKPDYPEMASMPGTVS